ncbi:MAG TPA: PH domain-containing protein, partial [Candidatus Bathyarchaeia archaeon]|nr:PH domain-containing protein [Candidatus Bathyarchaeia archaeon]
SLVGIVVMIKAQSGVIWSGKPWIGGRVAGSTVLAIAVAATLTWAELFFGVAGIPLLGLNLMFWTYAVLFLTWFFSILRSLIIRASNTYFLRETSLSVETGILSKRTIVVSSAGFADLEVVRSVLGRVLSVGDISIRSEAGAIVRLKNVRHPVEVSNMIRDVMTRPVFRAAR